MRCDKNAVINLNVFWGHKSAARKMAEAQLTDARNSYPKQSAQLTSSYSTRLTV